MMPTHKRRVLCPHCFCRFRAFNMDNGEFYCRKCGYSSLTEAQPIIKSYNPAFSSLGKNVFIKADALPAIEI